MQLCCVTVLLIASAAAGAAGHSHAQLRNKKVVQTTWALSLFCDNVFVSNETGATS
jgi:hypothetical protein